MTFAQLNLMSLFNNQNKQVDRPFFSSFNPHSSYPSNNYSGSGNLSSVIDFLERNFRKTPVHLSETPCYFYKGNRSKLEITVFSNPQIAKIDVRMIALRNYDREPSYECSYDLNGLSIAMFERAIEDLISKMA